RALFTEDHGAAGRTPRIGEVADFDSGDVSDRAAFILGQRIQTHGKFQFIEKGERGRGEAASQNVASRCVSHKSRDIRPRSRSGYGRFFVRQVKRRLEPAGPNRLRFWFRLWSAHG